MHVVQLSCHLDAERREPERLLAAWPTLSEVAAAVACTGARVSVVQAAHRDARLERDGVAYHFVAPGGAGVLAWRLARRVRALAPDVVHLQGLGFPLQARLLARAARAPVLVQDRADRPPPPWRRPLHRWGLARIAGAAFTAAAQAAPFVEAGVLRRDLPIFEVPGSSSRFTPGDQRAARAATGLHGDPCLLWVGRLDANKDPLTVLDALSASLCRLPGAQLWCCYTEAPLLARVRARLAAEPELAARVHLLGTVAHAQVQALCRAADFLVLGSHRESTGFAVLEALACGTPPLVTEIPAFRRLTGEGSVGALSPPGDAAAMARAWSDWCRRDRATLRRAARAHFERHLSLPALGAALRGVYGALRRPA